MKTLLVLNLILSVLLIGAVVFFHWQAIEHLLDPSKNGMATKLPDVSADKPPRSQTPAKTMKQIADEATPLPEEELRKIDGRLAGPREGYPYLKGDFHNGSSWDIDTILVTVEVTNNVGGVVVNKRLYRLNGNVLNRAYGVMLHPMQAETFSAEAGFVIEEGQKLQWWLSGAYGKPYNF